MVEYWWFLPELGAVPTGTTVSVYRKQIFEIFVVIRDANGMGALQCATVHGGLLNGHNPLESNLIS